jgi:hypothetical protein
MGGVQRPGSRGGGGRDAGDSSDEGDEDDMVGEGGGGGGDSDDSVSGCSVPSLLTNWPLTKPVYQAWYHLGTSPSSVRR